MKRSPLLSLCVGALLLSGCLHTATSSQAVAPTLTPIHTEALPVTARFLEFSGNGRTFIVAGKYNFVHLRDAATLEKRVAIDSGGELGAPDMFDNVLATRGAGYIDDNIWYVATDDGKNVSASIRQIDPPRELYKHDLGKGSERPVIANKNHLAYVGTLLNWHDGTSYKVDRAHPGSFGYTLTASSQVMTYNVFNGDVLLHDPVRQESMYWNIGFPIADFILSSDERYAVAQAPKGKCVLWQLPEKERLGSCGRGGLWGEKWTRSVFQRDGRAFAVSTDNEIRVYTVQPFKLLMKVALREKPVIGLTLDNGRLAAGDENGAISVWNVADGSLLGEYAGDPNLKEFYSLLAFQPGGNRLAVSQNNQLLVFELR